MRERIEDLGRLCVMIDKLLEHDVFSLITCRDKDFVDVFCEMKEEQKDDLLHSIAYGISGVRDELYNMLAIAQGSDLLNDREL
jgi:hypothetical protein